jgi:single-stranded-DNA-specific exonuclease
MLRRADVLTAESIGDGKHTKLTVGGKTALMFGMPLEEADIREGDTVDIVFKLDINEFRGMRSEQLLVCDMRLSDRSNCFQREADFLRGVENGDTFAESEGLLPDRNDFAVVYKEVRAYGEEGKTVSLYRLSKSLDGIRAAKIKLALEILGDVGLVSFETLSTLSLTGSELYRIAAAKTTEKVNLFGTPRYKAVKNRMQRN